MALGFIPNQLLDLLLRKSSVNSTTAQIDAKNAILFSQIKFKYYYDQAHQPINLKIDGFTVL